MPFKFCTQRSRRGVRGCDFSPGAGWFCGQSQVVVMVLTSACPCSPRGWADRMFWTPLCPERLRGRTGNFCCLRLSPASTALGPDKEPCLFSRWALRGQRLCTGARRTWSQTRPSCPGNGPVTPQHTTSKWLAATLAPKRLNTSGFLLRRSKCSECH